MVVVGEARATSIAGDDGNVSKMTSGDGSDDSCGA